MILREDLERQGHWLFRWRSYLPLLMLPFLLIAMRDSGYLERLLGHSVAEFWEGLCPVISFLGLAVRCLTVGYTPPGTSGRNTVGQEALTLNTTGAYSIMRHPLYFGNFVILLGMALFIDVWWFVIIFALAFSLYYERIMLAEERFLQDKFGEQYLDWAKKTPAFFPKFSNWRKPVFPFSIRKVLRKEYSGFFAIILTYALLDFLGNLIKTGKFEIDLSFVVLLGLGLLTYLTLRTLKKKTHLLNDKADRPPIYLDNQG